MAGAGDTATWSSATFGSELRRWRSVRGLSLSQLDLALSADVSQRHVSYLETGRSRPSERMVVRLAEALEIPLRDRNLLLAAAGYASAYRERGLDSAELAHLAHALDLVLAAHEPFPAYVVDRLWSLQRANPAAMTLTSMLPHPERAAARAGGNVLRLLTHPDGLKPLVMNWEHVARVLMRRLEREVAISPGDDELAALRAELASYPGVAELDQIPRPPSPDDLFVPLHLRTPAGQLRLITTIATIGASYDITLAELRLETLLPADPATESALRALATG